VLEANVDRWIRGAAVPAAPAGHPVRRWFRSTEREDDEGSL